MRTSHATGPSPRTLVVLAYLTFVTTAMVSCLRRVSDLEREMALLKRRLVVAPTTLTTTTSPALALESWRRSVLAEKSPPARPNVRVESETAMRRGPFGGRGDKPHLGGFVDDDRHGNAPALWEYLVKVINVKSMADVGCGRGRTAKWFADHNVEVMCVEGSKDAIQGSHLPRDKIVEHDFTLGPYWTEDRTYDLVLMVEVLEHISREHMDNYFPMLRRGALVLTTHAIQLGYHHVEVHFDEWFWRSRFEARGLVFSPVLTNLVREICKTTKQGRWYRQSAEVYINPLVAGLPEHSHLFGGPGCANFTGFTEDAAEAARNKLIVAIGGHVDHPKNATYRPMQCPGMSERFLPVWRGAPEGHWRIHERPEAAAMTSSP